MAQVGDIVRYIDAVGGGRITRIEGNMAYVDDDGFETPVLVRDCVVVMKAADVPAPAASARLSVETPKIVSEPVDEPDSEEMEETDYGDKITLMLAFEPRDILKLSTTTFDAYLVNDSNYYLYFSFLSRDRLDKEWTTRYAGIVEPNIQLLLGEVLREDLGSMEHIAVQYIAFKRDRAFELKPAVTAEYKLDPMKFLKLHCFDSNVYFDSKVLALEVVKDDKVTVPVKPDPRRLEKELKAKKAVDRQRRQPVRRREVRKGDIIEVDLHISELVDSTRGLSPADMLNLQVDEFHRVMDANLKNHGQKIVFIHGKGEGVLRQALMKELTHRYKGHDVQDASFQQYGFGATQVTIR